MKKISKLMRSQPPTEEVHGSVRRDSALYQLIRLVAKEVADELAARNQKSADVSGDAIAIENRTPQLRNSENDRSYRR